KCTKTFHRNQQSLDDHELVIHRFSDKVAPISTEDLIARISARLAAEGGIKEQDSVVPDNQATSRAKLRERTPETKSSRKLRKKEASIRRRAAKYNNRNNNNINNTLKRKVDAVSRRPTMPPVPAEGTSNANESFNFSRRVKTLRSSLFINLTSNSNSIDADSKDESTDVSTVVDVNKKVKQRKRNKKVQRLTKVKVVLHDDFNVLFGTKIVTTDGKAVAEGVLATPDERMDRLITLAN
ncbi:hypothetical protein HDU76_003980, partial [Blyttiomyces sp. JEL0837]